MGFLHSIEIKKVIKDAIRLKPRENVLIVYDEEKESIANLFFKACESITEVYSSRIKKREETRREPPKAIAEAMKFSDVILAITSISLTHSKAIRDAIKRGARVASMPGLNKKMFPALFVNYENMRKECKKLAKKFNGVKEIRIKTKLGTNLVLNCDKRKVKIDDGILDKKGNLHNLPAGEVFVAPIENSANGKIVFDVCMNSVGKIKNPIKIEVRNGRIVKISGREEANNFKKILSKADKNSNVLCEFSIGMNKNAKIVGEVLNDEKVFGTCHVAFGDNKNIGGKNKSNVHLDGVINKPTIWLDGKILMKEGVFDECHWKKKNS
ncbi:MAG: aminopeptidase [Candidatus Aenigmatarchaeota archaeon]